MFGQMDSMMRDMDSMMRNGGAMQGMAQHGGSGMMMMSSSNGGGGGFTSQTMMFSSTMGQDGQVRTERFSSSTVGDMAGRMREVQQAYSNSGTGTQKMSLERQLEGRGRKVVKERSLATGEERQTDLYKGMSEEHEEEFERDWSTRAAPRLPQHARGMQQFMLGDGAGGYPTQAQAGAPRRQALPPAPQQYQPHHQHQQHQQHHQHQPAGRQWWC
eukprot:SRR837773.12378.p1 GENE.SRR837773.12378~~SRR837773.12378.p1  ORF type:complete len:239 (-),score=54.87 SRR837773.12378:17-661(-)